MIKIQDMSKQAEHAKKAKVALLIASSESPRRSLGEAEPPQDTTKATDDKRPPAT